MSSFPRFAAPNRSWIRRHLGAAMAVTVFGTSAVLTTIPARADSPGSAQSGSFTIRGAGWGHGWGMSQYGAHGAARKGLTWKQILAFSPSSRPCPAAPRSRSGLLLTMATVCECCPQAGSLSATAPGTATPFPPEPTTRPGESVALGPATDSATEREAVAMQRSRLG